MHATIHDIYNFRQADERLATSGQPGEEELAAIAASGYAVIINLALHDDPRYSLPDEAASVRALELEYVHIPVQFTAPREEDLLLFFDAMDRSRRSKVWVHCAANKRVSVFVGLYRHLREGWSQHDAFALQRDIWEPNEVWAQFVTRMLAGHSPLGKGPSNG